MKYLLLLLILCGCTDDYKLNRFNTYLKARAPEALYKQSKYCVVYGTNEFCCEDYDTTDLHNCSDSWGDRVDSILSPANILVKKK